MEKLAIFKFSHCCLCPENGLRFTDKMEKYCKRENKIITEEESESFPEWCPMPPLTENIFDKTKIINIEEYMINKGIIDNDEEQ